MTQLDPTPFQAAMVAVGLEDAAAAGCIVCGSPSALAILWTPTERIRKALGQPDGKVRVATMAACAKHSRPRFARAREAAHPLARVRTPAPRTTCTRRRCGTRASRSACPQL